MFDFIVLLLQTAGRFLRDRAQLFGGGAQLRGGTGDLLDGFAQTGLHRGQGAEQTCRFILAIDFNDVAQVAARDGFSSLQCTVQRGDDAAGQQPGQQHGHQCGDHRNDHDAGDGVAVVFARFGRCGLGVAGVECHQFIELLAHLVGAVLDPRIDQGAHLIQLVLPRQFHHLVLRLHIGVEGGGERLVQRGFFWLGGQSCVAGLSAAQLVGEDADASLGFLQRGGFAVDQHPEREDAHAQDVFRHVAQKPDAGQLRRLHVDRGLANGRHAAHGKYTQHDDQQGNEGKTQESSRRDVQITQGHRTILG
ncbi:hypothetical protein D3C84_580810 [compost metagenome]